MLLQHASAATTTPRAVAAEATAIGERFGDRDLVAMGVMEQGHALVRTGRTEEGLRLVDEAMVSVAAGDLSPIVAGIVYCNTIAFCQSVFELGRARWTDALTRWCERQPEMVAHMGLCLVHRAEIMTLGGEWAAALDEAHRVGGRFAQGMLNQRAVGHAAYRRGEVHRLRGEFRAAEAAFRDASREGREPQPGLALLRLAQGDGAAAAAAIRRVLDETAGRLRRAALLPAYVEIMLAVGDADEARSACRELEETAEHQRSEALGAMSSHARGAVALAEGDARGALVALRDAWRRGRSLERHTRPRAPACTSGWRAARWATRTPPGWSSRRLVQPSSGWGPSRTSRASTRSRRAPRPATPMG